MMLPSDNPRQFDIHRYRYAFHEAGHVVTAAAMGRPIKGASIPSWPGGQENGSRSTWHWEGGVHSRGEVEATILVAVAGLEAERLLGLAATVIAEPLVCAGLDDRVTAWLARSVDDDQKVCEAFEHFVTLRADALLRQHWTQVEGVAEELLKRDTMSPRQVKEALEAARPVASRRALAM